MLLGIGKHKELTTQLVLLKHPDYVAWALDESSTGRLAQIVSAFRRHAAVLNAKPFVTRCRQCKAVATRGSYYQGTTDGQWWCDECDPYSLGAVEGRLRMVKSYNDALLHVQWTCDGRKSDYRSIIKDLSQAKGAPKRLGEAQAQEFLA